MKATYPDTGDIYLIDNVTTFDSHLYMNGSGHVYINHDLNVTGNIMLVADGDCSQESPQVNITLDAQGQIHTHNQGFIKLYGGDIHIHPQSLGINAGMDHPVIIKEQCSYASSKIILISISPPPPFFFDD